jgi:very-short-patch-repair endonuclease
MLNPRRRSSDQTERARQLRRDASRTERKLWPHLRGAQMSVSFRRQHPVEKFHLDYYSAELKLAVEIDGPMHDAASDSERDAILAAHGIEVLRFSVQEIDINLQGVADTIHREVRLRLDARQDLTRR